MATARTSQRSPAITSASLRFASDILRRLGEELNPNPDQGLLELAKNAYDADARECVLELQNVAEPGGTVRIVDDGVGLSRDAIVDGWLVLGRSRKDPRTLTALGRIPAGSKGLGRLAALRLGHEVELVTRPIDEPDIQYRLTINWDDFDDEALVEDVELELLAQPRQEEGPGTEIQIAALRAPLGRNDVKRLARSLVLLADPFGEDPSGFRPKLQSAEFEDLERLVEQRYFNDADYHLIATVDTEGRASARTVDWRGDTLFEGTHADIATRSRRGRPYEIPPAHFDLWVYLLNRAAFSSRTATVAEVREWLRAFGGVHLYVNGLRVSPYGNAGNDWLEMNVSRAASPEERPSTNTSLGRLAVTDPDHVFTQKTDRTGLIEDEHYEDLRAFARDAMSWLARRRLEVAEKRRAAETAQATKVSARSRANVEKQIEKAPEEVRHELTQAFHRYDRSRQQEADRLRRDVQLYRTLSTAGITAATFAHESSGNPLKIINQVAGVIERRGRKALDGDYDDVLGGPVQSLKKASKALSVLSSVTLALVDRDRRRTGRVDLQRVVRQVLDAFKPFFEGRDIEITTAFADGTPYLRGTEAAIESIITNLLNNSLAAFERVSVKQRTIEIRTEVEDGNWTMRVLDNGPGIDEDQIKLRDIWLPGESTLPNGTGLGLAIVSAAAADLGGTVDAVGHSDRGGAEIIVRLPVLGA